ncbi:class I adenylate-forming enzyme family protein [Lentzea tibetensis]|uniref:class I adenylate-forming enzyme family protein n=1 Tax=Lentzea tibetensis TaxID=2591470 RepID=UPI001C99F200|nr:AMP-binding protein [Lentzea tibetensis]
MPRTDAEFDLPSISEHYVTRILDTLAERGDDPVLWWEDAPVSGTTFGNSVRAATAALRELGVGTGSTVAILTRNNSPSTLTARYAAHLLGASVVHIRGANPGTSGPDLSIETQVRMLGETKASVLVFDSERAQRAKALSDLMPGGLKLGCFGAPVPGAAALDGPVAETDIAPQKPERANVTYTSGSTGRPKGVCLRFDAWNSTVLWGASAVPDGAAIKFLAVSPLSHSVGLVVDIMIAAGGTVLLHDGFEAGAALRAIERFRVTGTMIGVPQLYALLDHPDLKTTDVSSLYQLLYVGCPASPARLEQALPVFGAALTQNYGTTEAGRITLLSPADHQRPELLSTVGRPSPDVALKICDPETGREVGEGEIGEVCVRSTNMMSGYVDDPELTARVLRDGWLHTGDFGRLDGEGYLRLFGRIGDIIKAGDTKVYPADVEKVLTGHPDVVDACVYAQKDADELEHVHAAVVLRPDGRTRFSTLREHVGKAMSVRHAPVRFVRWEQLPLSASGKVDRQRVQQLGARIMHEDEAAVIQGGVA